MVHYGPSAQAIRDARQNQRHTFFINKYFIESNRHSTNYCDKVNSLMAQRDMTNSKAKISGINQRVNGLQREWFANKRKTNWIYREIERSIIKPKL